MAEAPICSSSGGGGRRPASAWGRAAATRARNGRIVSQEESLPPRIDRAVPRSSRCDTVAARHRRVGGGQHDVEVGQRASALNQVQFSLAVRTGATCFLAKKNSHSRAFDLAKPMPPPRRIDAGAARVGLHELKNTSHGARAPARRRAYTISSAFYGGRAHDPGCMCPVPRPTVCWSGGQWRHATSEAQVTGVHDAGPPGGGVVNASASHT